MARNKRARRPLEGGWVPVQFDGLDDRAYPERGLAHLEDVQHDWEQGLWRPSWGAVWATTGYDVADGAITAMHWFAPHRNQRFLIVERRTGSETAAISWLDPRNAGEPTDIVTDRRRLDALHQPARFLDYGRWCIFTSALDGPVRWDGERAYPLGFAAPAPQPTVQGSDQGFDRWDAVAVDWSVAFNARLKTKQRGVGEYPDTAEQPWRYGYRITMIDDMGQESPPSAMAYATGRNSADTFGRRMVLVHVPRLPPYIAAVRIWRTVNLFGSPEPIEGATTYLVATFTVAGGFRWVDHNLDNELIRELVEDNLGTIPQAARAAELWYGRMWMIGSPDRPNRLRYSAPGLVGQWPSINFFDVGSAVSGPGVALRATPRGLLVGKTDGLYLVKPQGDSFRLETLVEGVGVASPASICVIPDLGVFFVSNDGPMLLRGSLDDDQPTTVVRLDKGARKLWREAGDKSAARAVYDPARREVWVSTLDGGTNQLQLGLVYHVDANCWSQRTGWAIGAFEFYAGRLWMGSMAGLGVWAVSAASQARPSGATITGEVRTITLESHEVWAPTALELEGLAYGEPTIEIHTRTDRVPEWTSQSETARPQHHHMHQPDIWGVGLWDDGTSTKRWGDYEPSRFRISLDLKAGWAHQLRLTGSVFATASLQLETPPGTYHPRPWEETP